MRTINDIINEATAQDLKITGVNPDLIVEMLKDAFCEEMNAWYQYYIIRPFLSGRERTNIVADYAENASEELHHADELLERINQLGGSYEEIASPASWDVLATHKFILPKSKDVKDSVKQMIAAEKGAIDTYTKIANFCKDSDFVTYDLAKHILADEQKHLQEMEEFLDDLK